MNRKEGQMKRDENRWAEEMEMNKERGVRKEIQERGRKGKRREENRMSEE